MIKPSICHETLLFYLGRKQFVIIWITPILRQTHSQDCFPNNIWSCKMGGEIEKKLELHMKSKNDLVEVDNEIGLGESVSTMKLGKQ